MASGAAGGGATPTAAMARQVKTQPTLGFKWGAIGKIRNWTCDSSLLKDPESLLIPTRVSHSFTARFAGLTQFIQNKPEGCRSGRGPTGLRYLCVEDGGVDGENGHAIWSAGGPQNRRLLPRSDILCYALVSSPVVAGLGWGSLNIAPSLLRVRFARRR